MALPMLVGGSECGPSNALQGLSKRFDQDRGLQQDYFGAARAGSSREVCNSLQHLDSQLQKREEQEKLGLSSLSLSLPLSLSVLRFSSYAFRSQSTSGSGQVDQDAQRFFGNAGGPQGAGAMGIGMPMDAAFDVSAMRNALTSPGLMQQQGGGGGAGGASAAWASDFMMQHQQQSSSPQSMVAQSSSSGAQTAFGHQQHQNQSSIQSPGGVMQNGVPWNPVMSSPFRMATIPGSFANANQMHVQTPAVSSKRISWDREFNAQELNLAPATFQEPVQHIQEPTLQQQQESPNVARKEFEGDELAKTAGLLLEHIKHEQNPKFQKSQFLSLMKQFRDGEAIVDGNKVVESDGVRTSASSTVDVKGKGRAMDSTMMMGSGTSRVAGPAPQWASDFAMEGVQQQQQQAGQGLEKEREGASTVEDENDAYFRQENAEFSKYWNEAETQRERQQALGNAVGQRHPEEAAWDHLQTSWDGFEATSVGVKPTVSRYAFQSNNPYLLGESSKTRHHMTHLGDRQSMLENVLELEAAVQRDPSNASAWYELGVKQQENEREGKALEALQRSVALDPSLLPAWLALAISYTNDNDRLGTLEAITQWVERNDKYRGAAEAFKAQNPVDEHAVLTEKFGRMIQCLIAMARSDASGEVDADIQIALAVLLNTHEEYEKAQDCFRTALAVRPDDWLLYNRVGATMANSGQAEDALQYYYKALELNPGYIRARFNLGISCMNLKRYDEAAQHILDALSLQDSDAIASGDQQSPTNRRDVISTALWVSLKTTCLHLQRPDLANLCDSKDLEGFRNKFYS